MRNEKDVKDRIKKILKEYGVWFFMPVPTGMGVRGVPDFVCSYRGFFIGIEAKFGKNTQSSWQKRQEAGIGESGGLYLLINEKNLSGLTAVLDTIKALEGVPDDKREEFSSHV